MKTRGNIDPHSVADMWMRSMPKDHSRLDQMEMWRLVGAVSDNGLNAAILLDFMLGMSAREKIVYSRPLCGGLVLCSEKNGDSALAGVTPKPSKTKFECVYWNKVGRDEIYCTLIMLPLALVYSTEDKAMLFGILQHELRHYLDFLEENRSVKQGEEEEYMVKSEDGGYEIDVDKYARNIHEMRSHAEQAATLIRIMGGTDNAKKALRNSQFGSIMLPAMVETMEIFIELLGKREVTSEALDPVTIVRRSEDHDARTLKGHLERIIETMSFSNNVRPKA